MARLFVQYFVLACIAAVAIVAASRRNAPGQCPPADTDLPGEIPAPSTETLKSLKTFRSSTHDDGPNCLGSWGAVRSRWGPSGWPRPSASSLKAKVDETPPDILGKRPAPW